MVSPSLLRAPTLVWLLFDRGPNRRFSRYWNRCCPGRDLIFSSFLCPKTDLGNRPTFTSIRSRGTDSGGLLVEPSSSVRRLARWCPFPDCTYAVIVRSAESVNTGFGMDVRRLC